VDHAFFQVLSRSSAFRTSSQVPLRTQYPFSPAQNGSWKAIVARPPPLSCLALRVNSRLTSPNSNEDGDEADEPATRRRFKSITRQVGDPAALFVHTNPSSRHRFMIPSAARQTRFGVICSLLRTCLDDDGEPVVPPWPPTDRSRLHAMAAAAAASAAPPCTAIAALAKFDAISLLPLLPKVLVQSSRLLWWDGLILPDGPIHVTACEKKQAKEQRCLAPPPGHAQRKI
jgi:hypothetical protein